MLSKEELAKQIMENTFRILSALFDANGGIIELDKKTFEEAQIHFHMMARIDGDKVIIKKVSGPSELYNQHFPPKN